MRILSRRQGSAALAVMLTAAAATVAVTFSATRAPADTGAACAAAYSVGLADAVQQPARLRRDSDRDQQFRVHDQHLDHHADLHSRPDAGRRVGLQRRRDEQRRDADRDPGRDVQRRADPRAEHHLGV